VALPLALATSSWALMTFVDRIFLSWYSNDALAGVLPAGITNFCLVSFFLGTATYVNVFIAQYVGANQPQQVGRVLWQAIYFSILSGVILLGGIPLARPLFRFVGHEAAVQQAEVQYFRTLCYGSGATVLGNALSSFFIGRGKPMVVLCVDAAAAVANIVLDYAWIFGHWGFPRAGVRGAALATVVATVLRFTLYMGVILLPSHRRNYATGSGWRPDRHLFWRLMRFGLPSGVEFMLDILGFSLFVLLVGKISSQALAATNVAFNVNSLAFTPMLGFAFAVSALVGQYLGANRPDFAERSANAAFRITCIYVGAFCLLYITAPGLLLRLYGSRENPHEFDAIRRTVVILLRFIAVYSIFDMLNIIYAHAIKGAGDTRFVMFVSVGLSLPMLIIPTYLNCVVFKGNVYLAWAFMTAYIMALGLTFYLRFRSGKWKTMRVIEPVPRAPGIVPELPTPELDLRQRGSERDQDPPEGDANHSLDGE
jgi:MATE family multidrug resistance protein